MLHADRRRAESFGADAEQYDRARPAYPAELMDHLIDGLGREADLRVLDVGCGTGIASRLFMARGCRVLGVEPDARMAHVARRHGVEVELGHFETWESAGRRFDLLVSAQAWHWVDTALGTAKAAPVVRPGGRIGLFWNRGSFPAELQPDLDRVYAQAKHEIGDGAAQTCPDHWFHEDCQLAADALRAAGRWRDVATRRFSHVVEYTTESWLDQLPTHSDHRTLRPERLAALLEAVGAVVDAHGGQFEMAYTTWLVEALSADPGAGPDRPPSRG